MTGVQSVEGIRGRVELGLSASANGRRKTSLAGGTEAAATQGKEKDQGDVAHRAPFDQYPTAQV